LEVRGGGSQKAEHLGRRKGGTLGRKKSRKCRPSTLKESHSVRITKGTQLLIPGRLRSGIPKYLSQRKNRG